MKWLSSSLTSQVVSLVMLHESQPRRPQRHRPWPLEKPQHCYVYCLFEDTALLSDLHLPKSLLWDQGAWTFIVVQGAGPCSDRVTDLPHTSHLAMNSRNFIKQKIKVEPPF